MSDATNSASPNFERSRAPRRDNYTRRQSLGRVDVAFSIAAADKAIAAPAGNNAQTAPATMRAEIMHNGTERTREDAAGPSITDKTSPVFIRLSRGTSYQLQPPLPLPPPGRRSVARFTALKLSKVRAARRRPGQFNYFRVPWNSLPSRDRPALLRRFCLSFFNLFEF